MNKILNDVMRWYVDYFHYARQEIAALNKRLVELEAQNADLKKSRQTMIEKVKAFEELTRRR